MSNYAINPTPELALRSNRAALPARVIAALDFLGGYMVKWERFLLGVTLLAIPFSAWTSKQLEALENYEISSLSYWQQGPSNCVYVLDPEGFMHLALLGSGIGKNHGKITAISSKELEVTELFQSGDGEWHETKATLKAIGRVVQK